jgi:hypothetical protein
MTRPKVKKINRLDYCQYLLSTQTNYTITNYAEHVAGLSHDIINRYLAEEKLTPRLVWEHTKSELKMSVQGYIVFDDSTLDKNYSKNIEAVRWQYSGNAHKVIRGIGLVNCIYINPETKQFWLIDYRIFDPECDGKSKMDHVQEMLNHATHQKGLLFKTVLFDSWYASNALMLYVSDLGKLFYCPVKQNRLARAPDTREHYQPINQLTWNEDELKGGKPIRLRGMPADFAMKMFRVPVSTNRTDYVVTNDPSQQCSDDTRKVCAIRWLIEQFHRELKQLTGVEKCECRKQRIQRNHIACAVLVWVRLKKIAYDSGQTVYQIKKSLLTHYLIQELKSPAVSMSFA